MKELDGRVKIKKYTYDNGKPVCGECIFWPRFPALCKFMDMGAVDYGFPGPTCPIWHGESKNDKCLSLLKEARLCLEMWKDVAPAVSLCADIDKFLQENKP